jgi:hypothetical protein
MLASRVERPLADSQSPRLARKATYVQHRPGMQAAACVFKSQDPSNPVAENAPAKGASEPFGPKNLPALDRQHKQRLKCAFLTLPTDAGRGAKSHTQAPKSRESDNTGLTDVFRDGIKSADNRGTYRQQDEARANVEYVQK